MKKKGNEPKGTWSEDDVRKVITNPVYVGIGPFAQVIPDDQWIAAVSKLITERGTVFVLKEVLQNLREAFPAL